MQLDINPSWMKYDVLPAPTASRSDPTPVTLLPNQQPSAYSVLLDLHPGLHGGIRAVTIDKTLVPGENTGPQAAASAAALPVTPARWLIAVIRETRPRQWPKNLLVFAAPLAAASLGRNDGFAYALLAMFAFACASAAVYFVNDVVDAERDRRHPVKRNRPIASGALPAQHALALGALAVVLAVGAGVRNPRAPACRGGLRLPLPVSSCTRSGSSTSRSSRCCSSPPASCCAFSAARRRPT